MFSKKVQMALRRSLSPLVGRVCGVHDVLSPLCCSLPYISYVGVLCVCAVYLLCPLSRVPAVLCSSCARISHSLVPSEAMQLCKLHVTRHTTLLVRHCVHSFRCPRRTLTRVLSPLFLRDNTLDSRATHDLSYGCCCYRRDTYRHDHERWYTGATDV